MSLRAEIAGLRQDLRQMYGETEIHLARRYALRFPPRHRMSLYRRLRMAVGRILRDLGLRRTPPPEPWLPGLKHVERSDEGRPLVIWALGTDRDTLLAACRGFEAMQDALPDFVPVLITDIADFSFFSRLSWLIEYVPALSAPADGYAERKRRYLAWRYRDAPAVPVSAGLRESIRIEELLIV